MGKKVPKASVLIIDDEREIGASLKDILEDEGYEASYALFPDQAWEMMLEHVPSVVLLDVWFGKTSWDGVRFLETLRQVYPLLPIIIISGHATLELAVRAIQNGAWDFVEKPFDLERLVRSVAQAIESHRPQPLPCSYASALLCGQSSEIRELRQSVKKLSMNLSRVVIEGQCWSGKTSIAMTIHQMSRRCNGPFVQIHAQELNEATEEMLWGKENAPHVSCVGFFERARGGTLVIRNIHELSEQRQEALVRLLDKGTWQRVGGSTEVPFQARLISLSRFPLAQWCAEGRFCKRLFHRLAVASVCLPSLYQLRQNLSEFLAFISKEIAKAYGVVPKTFSPEAVTALTLYPWPGNFRELWHFVERFYIVHSTDIVQAHQLFPEMQEARHALGTSDEVLRLRLADARALFEWQYLQAKLIQFSGNITETAHDVGLERSALHRKLRELQGKISGEKAEGQHRRSA